MIHFPPNKRLLTQEVQYILFPFVVQETNILKLCHAK